jgi:cellulose synthase/poly-beta-1,6-N-acetylglucosamine synthase-like glycosyltransferase
VVANVYGDDPRVRLVHQKNQGKAQALNHGYRLAESEIIVAIDADTIILPDAVSRLVRHFANPKVGAVAGNTKVGNRVNILTRLQAVEYITSQNLDRRAFERFNAILVVPGSIGAWRKSVVEGVGGYSSETLAEDADLTVAIIRAGYRVTYEAGAIAMTEAPETLSQLLRQRLRWSLGIMQTGWKHKRAIREGNGIGLVAIPNILLFGVILSLFAPIADIVFISALFRLGRDFIHHPTMIPGLSSPAIFIAYAAYLLSDVFLSALALVLEPKEDKRLLFWVPFQRFFYRQLLYIATLRSVGRALTGRLTGWQKLTRTADVSVTTPRARYEHRDVELQRVKPAAKP